MSKRQTYTKEFKIEAVRLLEESDKKGIEISRELGIQRNMLYKWQKELQTKGDSAFAGPGRKPADSDDQVAKLRKENDQLREEVEILKKAAAYFARDMK
jgi:transposase